MIHFSCEHFLMCLHNKKISNTFEISVKIYNVYSSDYISYSNVCIIKINLKAFRGANKCWIVASI